jgi:hypothetical protein
VDPDEPRFAVTSVVQPYKVLCHAFVDGRLAAAEFQLLFVELFKRDQHMYGEAEYALLSDVFGAAECYRSDPDPDDRWEVGEDELRAVVATALPGFEAID